MANYYFTTGSGNNGNFIIARVQQSGTATDNRYYVYPANSLKFNFYLPDFPETGSYASNKDGALLYIHDIHRNEMRLIIASGSDDLYINGTLREGFNPPNALGMFNAFTASGILY